MLCLKKKAAWLDATTPLNQFATSEKLKSSKVTYIHTYISQHMVSLTKDNTHRFAFCCLTNVPLSFLPVNSQYSCDYFVIFMVANHAKHYQQKTMKNYAQLEDISPSVLLKTSNAKCVWGRLWFTLILHTMGFIGC